MKKPYIVCHMMTSVDGRIDCATTEQLPGVQEYYAALDALDAPARVSGRVTAQLEMAQPGTFRSERPPRPLAKRRFAKACGRDGLRGCGGYPRHAALGRHGGRRTAAADR